MKDERKVQIGIAVPLIISSLGVIGWYYFALFGQKQNYMQFADNVQKREYVPTSMPSETIEDRIYETQREVIF
ncbi:MAG: hypothetical protein ACTSQG_11825 [Promethearchaeota archaeon]